MTRSPTAKDCRSVAVFRALQLGDMLCAVPALRALRAGWPRARITLVGLPWAASFARRFAAYVDDFVSFPGTSELPEQVPDVARLPAFFTEMRARRFDFAVQMHGNGVSTNAIVARFGARRFAGFCVPATARPCAGRYLPYPEHLHEIRRNLALAGLLGVPTPSEALEFPLLPADFDALASLPQVARLRPREYVCLHPGARDPAKRWPAERFARVGDTLQARGYEVVLTGTAAEHELAETVARHMRAPSVNCAANVPIGALAALLSRARLLVTNDTGVSHVAAGLRLPSVVMFFATDPTRWAPLDRRRHRVVHDPAGIDASSVLRVALQLLDDTAGAMQSAAGPGFTTVSAGASTR
jgi:ADP-heptose:LPS heptosyltransferase